nr:MAG TPA: helix-turn-helix domain protein [Caudoviricetes sp.]
MRRREYHKIDAGMSYRIGEAAELLGISANTLRKDARSGIVDFLTSPKGHMLFLGTALIRYRKFCL